MQPHSALELYSGFIIVGYHHISDRSSVNWSGQYITCFKLWWEELWRLATQIHRADKSGYLSPSEGSDIAVCDLFSDKLPSPSDICLLSQPPYLAWIIHGGNQSKQSHCFRLSSHLSQQKNQYLQREMVCFMMKALCYSTGQDGTSLTTKKHCDNTSQYLITFFIMLLLTSVYLFRNFRNYNSSTQIVVGCKRGVKCPIRPF